MKKPNALFLADNHGLPLAVATLQAGNQHDTFELERGFTELCDLLEAAGLRLEGLFLNTDKAFDISSLRQACERRGTEANIPRNRRSADWQTDDDTPLDPKRYPRLAMERLNAWLDGVKTLPGTAAARHGGAHGAAAAGPHLLPRTSPLGLAAAHKQPTGSFCSF